MGTVKPRITVTLDLDDYELLKELSALNGESMSAIISGLVGAARPVLDRLVEFAKTFSDASAARQSDILALLEGAEAKVVPEAHAIAEELLAALTLPASDPRAVNTGVYTPTPSPSPNTKTGV